MNGIPGLRRDPFGQQDRAVVRDGGVQRRHQRLVRAPARVASGSSWPRPTSRPATAGPSWRRCRRASARSTSSIWSPTSTRRWSCARCSTGWSPTGCAPSPASSRSTRMGGEVKQYQVVLDPRNDGRLQADAARRADRPASRTTPTSAAATSRRTASSSSSAARRSSRTPRTSPTRCSRSTRDGTPDAAQAPRRGAASGPALRYGVVTKHGKGEIVAGTVMMLIGANSREVVKRVKAKLAEIQKELPAGRRRSVRTTTAPSSSSGC